MSGAVPSGETRPDISIGRDDALVDPDPRPEATGSGHPLPASERARHGSLPESIDGERSVGAN